MKRVAVYCGSSPGNSPAIQKAARELGHLLAQRKIDLVYGGGSVGLMGILARSLIDAGGKGIGVIPEAIAKMEVAFDDIQDLRVVKDMHSRKALIAELSDGFIALPGGVGTIEELMEVLTWAGLGFHQKPVGVLNCEDFFNPLLSLLDDMVAKDFIAPEQRAMLLVDTSPEKLLAQFSAYRPPEFDKAKRAKQASQQENTET